MTKRSTKDLDQDKAFIEAGFTKEQVGSVTIYRRAVPEDVIDTAVHIASKRTIGKHVERYIPWRSGKRLSKAS